jgi:hypothetical protein
MGSQTLLRVARAAFGALGLAAVAEQYVVHVQRGGSPANFFSFFTILSNIFATCLLLYEAWRNGEVSASPLLSRVRGAAVLYMTITGVVYALLLSGLPDPYTLPWINRVVHEVMPLVVVVDWVVDPPANPVAFPTALNWLGFPTIFLIYTMVRGAVTGWYPYPFLSPASRGYGAVAAQCVIILVGAVALIWCIVALPTRRGGTSRERGAETR